jgi:very-short-patch-repair endonuclease
MKNLHEIIKKSKSRNDALLKYYGYANKGSYNKINNFILQENIDISHWKKKDKHCLNCNSKIENHKKFCNSSCAARYNNKKRKLSDLTKKKISDTLKKKPRKLINKTNICIICDSEYKQHKTKSGLLSKSKTCSDACGRKLKSIRTKEVMAKLISEGKHKGWIKRNVNSYPELFFINVLKNNGIEFKYNYPIKQRDLGMDNSYNYFLDFYFENLKLDLEIDGKQHERRKKHDDFRDALLTKHGIKVYRIKWKSLNNEKGKLYIKNEINKFLDYYNNLNGV